MKKNKKTKEKNKEIVNINSESFQNKQLRNIILVMGIIILAGILTYLITNSLANPEYKGLKFTEKKAGNLKYYEVYIPIIDPLTGKTNDYYPLDLRTNPEDLDKISFYGQATKFQKNITISFNTDIGAGCPDTIIGVANFVKVFNGNLGYNVRGESHDQEYANKTGLDYITCDDANKQTVIIVQNATAGQATEIKETVPNCYVINVNQCETVQAFERFMLEAAVKSTATDKN